MNFLYSAILIILINTHIFSQSLSPEFICDLPNSLSESSGLFAISSNEFWSFGDSGNADELIKFDSIGNKIKTIKVSNASNEDWESITDDGNYTYIGDFGNNTSNRTDLVIYKISSVNKILNNSISPQKINFSYEDQIDFNPPIGSWEYDCEAMISIRDSLYLFTKDYTFPFKGQTKVYKLSKSPEKQQAKLIAIIPTNNQNYNLGQITDAAISPNNQSIALLANNGLYIFDQFNSSEFWNGRKRFFLFDSKLQREGISFMNDSTIYLTNEFSSDGNAALHKLNLASIVSTSYSNLISEMHINLYYNQFDKTINIESDYYVNLLEIYDLNGKLIKQNQIKSNSYYTRLDLTSGIYLIKIKLDNGNIFNSKILVN